MFLDELMKYSGYRYGSARMLFRSFVRAFAEVESDDVVWRLLRAYSDLLEDFVRSDIKVR
jgi:hypothetical protein